MSTSSSVELEEEESTEESLEEEEQQEEEEQEYEESLEDTCVEEEEERVEESVESSLSRGSASSEPFIASRPFDIESGSFMSFIQGEGPTDITKAAGQYVWNVNLPGWIFRSNKEQGAKQVNEAILMRRVARLCCHPNFDVKFADKLAYNTIQRFEDDFRIKATSTAAISLTDVKDVIIYTALIDIPKLFIRFFYTLSVDKFLRSLIIYMQYLLQVCRALKRRREEKETKLWHPNTGRKYREWKSNLDMFRFVLGRNYFFLVTGRPKDIWPFRVKAHLGSRDYKRDKMLFELLYVFGQRVVEISLYERGNKIISGEMQRLFRPEDCLEIEYLKDLDSEQREVIESKFFSTLVPCKSPAVRELGRPGRRLPFKAELEHFLLLGDQPIPLNSVKSQVFSLLQEAYCLNERYFSVANIRLGILGYKRENFNPTLTDQTSQVKFDEAEIPLDTGLSFSEDPAQRYPEPSYLVPKVNKRQPFNLSITIKPMEARLDRCAFWLKNSKLRHRVISDYIMSMNE